MVQVGLMPGKSFLLLSWSSIQPGDIVYISGGSDSTQYNEQLTVGKSGTAGNPITYNSRKIFPFFKRTQWKSNN